jgi:hypothetical protein
MAGLDKNVSYLTGVMGTSQQSHFSGQSHRPAVMDKINEWYNNDVICVKLSLPA